MTNVVEFTIPQDEWGVVTVGEWLEIKKFRDELNYLAMEGVIEIQDDERVYPNGE